MWSVPRALATVVESTEALKGSELRRIYWIYRGADKPLAWPTSRYILFDGENISFDASLVIYVNSINIPPIMIINCGPGSVVGIATAYELDGPGIESR